ncbi:MAG: STAS domain-containing protein [Candidatus Zhuqueibacterota bacterium]
MEIHTETSGHTGIIRFLGKTLGEPADSKQFETQFKTLLKGGVKNVILDLHQVNRINSTGLAILITATTLLSNTGGSKVALAGSNDFIQGALTLTRLNQFFDCFDDVSQATQQLQSSGH